MFGYNYLVTRTKSDGTPDMSRIKIGYFTGENIEEKIYKTYSRSLTPVYLFDYVRSNHAIWSETAFHYALDKFRVDPRHEVFDLSSSEALNTYREAKRYIEGLVELSDRQTPVERSVNYQWWLIARDSARLGIVKSKRCLDALEKREAAKRKRDGYVTRVNEIVPKKTQLELKKDQNKKRLDAKKASFCKFLKENTRYKDNAYVFMDEIRILFNKEQKKDVRSLDNSAFKDVNENYVVEIIKTCKHCQKEAIKGCCTKYNNKDRTVRRFVRNLELKIT